MCVCVTVAAPMVFVSRQNILIEETKAIRFAATPIIRVVSIQPSKLARRLSQKAKLKPLSSFPEGVKHPARVSPLGRADHTKQPTFHTSNTPMWKYLVRCTSPRCDQSTSDVEVAASG